MNETAFLTEQLMALRSAEGGEPAASAVITGMRLDGGSYHVLSRYEDSVWILPDSLFAAGIGDGKKKLNFERVPGAFRPTMRACVARYMLVGIEGRARPRGGTIRNFFRNACSFLRWLDKRGITNLNGVSSLLAQQYVDYCRSLKSPNGKPLSATTLDAQFRALETLHILSGHTADSMQHPWPESSGNHLAGLTGHDDPRRQEAKTAVIPDDVLGPLFQACVEYLDRADEILTWHEQITVWQTQGWSSNQISSRLKPTGWTQGAVKSALRDLQSASMVIVLVTSGIRVSELCSLETGCAYSSVGEHGDRLHWMRGISYKTAAGACEWLVAGLTHRAIAVAERVAEPLQARVMASVEALRTEDPNDPEVTRLSEHTKRLFLGVAQRLNNRIETLSSQAVLTRINAFATKRNLNWHFAPHQFRRTFAVYAAHSAFGDLRYLRDHLKHWSLDMTTLYAMNRKQDAELYDALATAALGIKTDLLEHWLEPDAILTGGASDQLRAFRAKSQSVKTEQGRAEMARSISPLVNIRATGVAWCTADTGGCNGGQGFEKTRCGDCGNAIIDASRKHIWQGIYAQQLELRELPEIGPAGQERVERDIQKCRKVLIGLGATGEELDDVGT
ncbi:tyrosine-type recombinase/integrase [Parahalioglobus pacificus]|uniref:Integrase n=1 Tax=Parahalioglobus pacificus TaxID=930806 RepID=A0A918XII9_9GAMM|nr:tyrosine-type recombinase/integrase [Halioglobus pacificus]GHD33525.1 integrase [Halioglobus pacificus]